MQLVLTANSTGTMYLNFLSGFEYDPTFCAIFEYYANAETGIPNMKFPILVFNVVVLV